MLGVRFLSLMVIFAALLLARVAAISPDLVRADRAGLPSDSGGDQGGLDDDGLDLALPPGTTPTPVALPARRVTVEPERAPAPSPFADSIFRPPTSSLA